MPALNAKECVMCHNSFIPASNAQRRCNDCKDKKSEAESSAGEITVLKKLSKAELEGGMPDVINIDGVQNDSLLDEILETAKRLSLLGSRVTITVDHITVAISK